MAHGWVTDLDWFNVVMGPLVKRKSAFRLRQALTHMINIRGFERTKRLVFGSSLQSQIMAIVPDLFA